MFNIFKKKEPAQSKQNDLVDKEAKTNLKEDTAKKEEKKKREQMEFTDEMREAAESRYIDALTIALQQGKKMPPYLEPKLYKDIRHNFIYWYDKKGRVVFHLLLNSYDPVHHLKWDADITGDILNAATRHYWLLDAEDKAQQAKAEFEATKQVSTKETK